MHRFFSILTVFLFLIFLSIPPLISLLTIDLEISQTEKRKLASLPPLNWNPEQIVEFPGKFEEYYNDHFGLRDTLVFYQQLFSFKVFNVSSTPVVTVGRDGWLFFNDNAAIHAFMGLMPLASRYLESYRWTLMDRRDWLAERGINYLFLPIPNKESIYPEFLPRRIQRHAGTSIYDQVIPYLAKHSGFTEYLDLKNIFLAKKQEEQLYFRTDSHWNYRGSFAAYQNIAGALQLQQVPVAVLPEEDITWSTTDFSGDLAVLLHMYKTLNETAPLVDVAAPCTNAEQQEQAELDVTESRLGKFADDPRNFIMVAGCPDRTTRVLVLHDSFGEFLKPFLSNTFGTTYYVKRGFSEVKDFIEWARPDVVIDQRVERNVLLALAPDRDLETAFLRKRFPRSRDLVLCIDGNSLDEELSHLPTVSVDRMEDGLLVQSAGKYPFLGFTYDPQYSDAPLMVRIRLTSQLETHWLLYYTTPEFPDFIPANTVSMPVQKGYNEFFFRLPYPGTAGKLQFHPGAEPGEYILHSFIIKREDWGRK